MGRIAFPPGFLWGSASAAYQVEGSPDADGKGPSIWDTYSHTPGRTKNGDTGDVAVDHYQRIEDDLDLMVATGLNAYRFSVSWPRVQPEGRGRFNEAGIDYYRRVAGLVRERGLEPVVTLYHWDLPQALEDSGGWPVRDTALYFADYAQRVAGALEEWVGTWVTVNEPSVVALLGYGQGTRAPGRHGAALGAVASHHLLLAHGLGAEAVRATTKGPAKVGIVLDPVPMEAASDGPNDQLAARRADAYWNRWFLDAVLLGQYPAEMFEIYERAGSGSFVKDGDMTKISSHLDFLGLNYYTKHTVASVKEPLPHQRRRPAFLPELEVEEVLNPDLGRTAMGWEVRPDGLTEVLVGIGQEYGDVPIYITENGAAYDDYVGPDGSVHDGDRITYLREHLLALHDAIAAGADVRGYFVWTFVDNFEWTDGYSRRFGLVYVHFPDQRRYLKDSAVWFGQVARQNAVDLS